MEKETGMGMGMERLPQTAMGIITPAASLIEEQRITIDRVKEERQLQLLREEREEQGLLKEEESAGSTPPTSGANQEKPKLLICGNKLESVEINDHQTVGISGGCASMRNAPILGNSGTFPISIVFVRASGL